MAKFANQLLKLGNIYAAARSGESEEVANQVGKEMDAANAKMNKVISKIAIYFDINTSYVKNKLKLLCLPFFHRNWNRRLVQGEGTAQKAPPRADLNAPDLYIPLMSLLTAVLFLSYIGGISTTATFHFSSLYRTLLMFLWSFDEPTQSG
ncbi:hypothetical protein PCE1_004706 [Barthelona sp. PCE]